VNKTNVRQAEIGKSTKLKLGRFCRIHLPSPCLRAR